MDETARGIFRCAHTVCLALSGGYPTATDTDNVSAYLLPIHDQLYFTRGVEAWAKWNLNRNFDWMSSVTFANGKVIEEIQWRNIGANGQGAADDEFSLISGPIARSPRWVLSNTFNYRYKDFSFSARHRWMDERKVASNPLDTRYLPAQDNLDLAIQYTGIKDTRIALDIRNALDTTYVSRVDTMIGGTWPTNVVAYDIYNQLPDSATLVRRNAPRSFWLTIKHDF
ncbi:TonB-dependent receptor [Asticcacaulis excentricus]|nr:TonB-dependent receptor [Asticcacaulis excentricus]